MNTVTGANVCDVWRCQWKMETLVLLLIEKMRESGDILSHHGWLHLPDHKAGFSEEQQAIWQKQSHCLVTSRGGCVTAKETGTDEQAMRLTLRRGPTGDNYRDRQRSLLP